MKKEVKQEIVEAKKTFDDMKHIDENGNEYWNTRELSKGMGYERYDKFKPVIEKAKTQMENTGINPDDHMSQSGHMVQIGSGTTREVDDYHVDRRGAYTIAVNADPHKSEVAYAKEYFIQKTAKAEVMEQRLDTLDRINNRNANSIQNKKLRNALLTRDVEPNELGIVLDKGSKGFFDQSSAEFKEEKGIPKSRSLYDYLDADVLAYKTVAQVNSRREIEKHDLHGVEETGEAIFDEHRKMREMFIDKFEEAPEDIPLQKDIKKVEKQYDKETMKLLEKLEREEM